MTVYEATSGYGRSYAACELHTYDALCWFKNASVVRIDHLDHPHVNMKCHCGVPANVRLIEIIPRG